MKRKTIAQHPAPPSTVIRSTIDPTPIDVDVRRRACRHSARVARRSIERERPLAIMRVRHSRASGADEESALLRDADEDVNTRRWTRSRRIAVAVGGMCVVACGVVATMSGSLMGEGVGAASSLATRFGGSSRLGDAASVEGDAALGKQSAHAKERQKKLYRYAVKQEEKEREVRKTRRVERREAEAAQAATPADSATPAPTPADSATPAPTPADSATPAPTPADSATPSSSSTPA